MKIWIEFANTPHVNVLLPVIRHLKKRHEIIITARDFSETIPLLRKNGIEPMVLGRHQGKSKVKKVIGLVFRIASLIFKIPRFDISISLGGNYTATVSRFRRKPSIVFSDNDISFKVPAYKFGSYFIFPEYFNSDNLSRKYGIDPKQIFKYNGFKEDIYIADYVPDPSFTDILPFKDFITIRPENLKASYVPIDSETIVPRLFEKFKDENILFLPRYNEEKKYAEGYKNIFIPDGPLNGLDVCYYTKCMLTGAGTFARESALLGTPAVTFFPGKVFLTVDEIMIEKGMEFRSRDVDEIYKYVKSAQRNRSKQDQSELVQIEVFNILDNILANENKK